MSQKRLPEMPTVCCRIGCEARPKWVLVPGYTGHCGEHDPHELKRFETWEDAFDEGRARIIEVRERQ